MDEERQHEPKISLPEGIVVGLCFLLLELLDVLPLLGPLFSFLVTQAYLWFKGVRGTYLLIGNTLELLLSVGWVPAWLPIRTASFIITWWLDHHPKAEAAVGKVARVVAVTAASGGAASPVAGAVSARGGAAARAGVASVGERAKAGVEGTARGEAAPTKTIPWGALGEEKPIFETLKEPLTELPEPSIALDDERNQVDLRKAA